MITPGIHPAPCLDLLETVTSSYQWSWVMTKPVYSIRKQQRCRSACASVQSGQHLCCLLHRSMILTVCKANACTHGRTHTRSDKPKAVYPLSRTSKMEAWNMIWSSMRRYHTYPLHSAPVWALCEGSSLRTSTKPIIQKDVFCSYVMT